MKPQGYTDVTGPGEKSLEPWSYNSTDKSRQELRDKRRLHRSLSSAGAKSSHSWPTDTKGGSAYCFSPLASGHLSQPPQATQGPWSFLPCTVVLCVQPLFCVSEAGLLESDPDWVSAAAATVLGH